MVLEALWLKTGNGVYANLYRYWLKIFAVAFGMGVVSGVMSYQFGTNWSVFSNKAGPVIGPLMAYEVLPLLPRSGLSRRDAVRHQQGREGIALFRNVHGRARHADLGDLDHRAQQLDADAGGLRDQCQGRFVPTQHRDSEIASALA
jgi:hypothetical protein